MNVHLISIISMFVWISGMFIFFLIEMKRKDIFFIYLSFASFLSLIVAIFTENIEIQIVVFIVSSLILIIFLKTIVDKIIEFNVNFRHGKYIEDRICIIIKEEDNKVFMYKVLTKSGIYTAKYILKERAPKKFKICSIVHDDGNVILIK